MPPHIIPPTLWSGYTISAQELPRLSRPWLSLSATGSTSRSRTKKLLQFEQAADTSFMIRGSVRNYPDSTRGTQCHSAR